ncbi:MAG: ATP-binding protein [Draconibacterium sp.]|nr:ATP-binding protein [Draconibacterium sp.]
MISRLLENIILQKIGRKKALIILGARQAGKTTLIKKILTENSEPTLLLNADLPAVQQQLKNPSINELKQVFGKSKLIFIDEAQLQHRIIFGMYPDVINNLGEEKETLLNLTESYLYKDIIAFQQLRKPEFVQKLLQALAFQVGNEVSYNELSNLLQIDRKTIIHYIDLLEKAFVIFRLPSFCLNLRKELSSKIKIYFYDIGIRNALIGDYRTFELRNDKEALWENFLVAERKKANHYNLRYVNSYFWGTHQKQEIDYIEEADGELQAFEFKWNKNAKFKLPKTFSDAYKNVKAELVTSDNFHNFLTNDD